MNDNSNMTLSQKLEYEAIISEGTSASKWGSTLLLVLGAAAIILAPAIAIRSGGNLSPLTWVVVLSDPIVYVICGIFARKGRILAFIVPLVIHAFSIIFNAVTGQWVKVIARTVVLILLSIALRRVLAQKRAEQNEAQRQLLQ